MEATAWAWQDSLTLGLFFAGMLGIVVWVLRQKEETSSDYFLAGRNAGWLAIGAWTGDGTVAFYGAVPPFLDPKSVVCVKDDDIELGEL